MLPGVLGVRRGTPQRHGVMGLGGWEYDVFAERVVKFLEEHVAVDHWGRRHCGGSHDAALRTDARVLRALAWGYPVDMEAAISSSAIWSRMPSSRALKAAQTSTSCRAP